MRRRAAAALVALGLGITLGLLGRGVGSVALLALSGALYVAALGLAVSLLPVWRRSAEGLEPMPGLFRAPGSGERWCIACGRAAPAAGACTVCGGDPPPPRGKAQGAAIEKKRKA